MVLIKTDRPSWALSRRTFLRGAGTLVALPLLDAMLDAPGARAQAATPPRRFFAFYVPNGIVMDAWTPSSEGEGYALTPILQPLANLKSDVVVLSGLRNFAAFAQGDGPGDHARGTGCFLTATHLRKTEGSDIRNGVSVDQIIAEASSGQTRFSSLELGCEGGGSTGGCDSGYSCAYSRNISWAGPATPMPKETNPRAAFDRLFSGTNPTETAEARARRKRLKHSVLDYVKADAARIQAKVGARDKAKLDEYLSGVRDIEARLDAPEGAVCAPPSRPEGVPGDTQAYVRLMLDITATAFACDVTRVATFMLGNGGSGRSYPFLGVSDAHHEISHHQGDQAKIDKLQIIDTWEVEQLAYFLEKLKGIDEAGQNVLFHSTVFFSSEIEDGNSHFHGNLPVLVAGQGGGTIRTGRHVRVPDETPIANLFLSLIGSAGGSAATFGDDGDAPLSLA
jgi:hypothetical protein